MNCDSTVCNKKIPSAMTIAGSDSGGGAGIQADLRTFSAMGVFGTSAITAITAQNPQGVYHVESVSPQAIEAQLNAVFQAFDLSAIKTGMLFSCETIEVIADFLKKVKIPVVVDPVMVSTSGSKLLCDDALGMLQTKIFPLAHWLTPNMPEAELLSGIPIKTEKDCWLALEKIAASCSCSVILKGGHAESSEYADDYVMTSNGEKYILSAKRIPIKPYASHGTGCTLSSAMAARIALGDTTCDVLLTAKNFVLESLSQSRFAGTPENQIHVMFPPEQIRHSVTIRKV